MDHAQAVAVSSKSSSRMGPVVPCSDVLVTASVATHATSHARSTFPMRVSERFPSEPTGG